MMLDVATKLEGLEIESFLSSLQHIAQQLSPVPDPAVNGKPVNHDPRGESGQILQDFCNRRDFQAVVKLLAIISEFHRADYAVPSTTCDLKELSEDVTCELDKYSDASENASELLTLIGSDHLQALFGAFESVASAQYEPSLADIPFEVDEDDGLAIKVVRLIKHNEPLGATIKVQESTGSVVVARVMCGGVADRSGCIHVGDRVLEVNGFPVDGKKPEDIVKILSGSSNGSVTLKLIPVLFDSTTALSANSTATLASGHDQQRRIHVRALFSYEATQDMSSPCTEAALSFKKGDVLQLLSSEDQHWWQARLVSDGLTSSSVLQKSGDRNRPPLVGLVPSKFLQEKREHAKISQQQQQQPGTTTNSMQSGPFRRAGSHQSSIGSTHHAWLGSGRKIKPMMYETQAADDLDQVEVKIYEEVALLYPSPNIVRPLVIIGASGVGRNELKRRLMLMKPNYFTTTIPHTSRPPRPGEVSGADYHFTNRASMLQWIKEGRFIEYGEYKGNFYGTMLDSVKSIIDQRRCCILNPHPQAIKMLRTAEIKPFLIFVKPPPFPLFKATRSRWLDTRSTFVDDYSRGFTDDELKRIIESSLRLETKFSHCFDYNLTNANIDVSFRELCDVIASYENKPQWVPANWVR